MIPGLQLRSFPIAPAPVESSHWPLNDDRELIGYRAGGHAWLAIPGVAAYCFTRTGDVEATPDGASGPEIEDAFLRSVLPLVLQARGTQVLHASAVEGAAGTVALCGPSTAGKSTLAATLMVRGHPLVADDALGFDVSDERVVALPLPFRLRLRQASAAALGLPGVAAEGSGGGELPLAAIVLLAPHDEGDVPELEPAAAADAFGALMPQAYCFSLEEGKEQLVEAYLALTRLVPVQWLSYPQEIGRLDEAADALEELLGA